MSDGGIESLKAASITAIVISLVVDTAFKAPAVAALFTAAGWVCFVIYAWLDGQRSGK